MKVNDIAIKCLQLRFAIESISLEIQDTKEIIDAICFVVQHFKNNLADLKLQM